MVERRSGIYNGHSFQTKRSGYEIVKFRHTVWLIAAILTLQLLNRAPANPGKALKLDDIFPTDRVLDIQITVEKEDWDTIRYQTRTIPTVLGPERQFAPPEGPYTYVKAKVVIDGVVFPDVGLRKKGFIGSQSSRRPSLKVKLNFTEDSHKIDGLSVLTLNNNRQDKTHMSQFMGYALFNRVGSPAPRCAFAKVTVNGVNLGIYSHVESARKPLVKRGFGNASGTLYEGTVTDFFDDWDGSFENKIGDDKPGRKKIKQLIKAMEHKAGNTILGAAAKGRAFVPIDDQDDEDWMAVDFDDDQWEAGRNGAGYETQLEDKRQSYEELIAESFDFREQMHEKRTSVYLRFPFQVRKPGIDDKERLLLRMKYDDGFVAYLNGHQVASANAPGEVRWDSVATAPHDDSAAKKFQSFDITEHQDKLRPGPNLLAIHGLNISPGSTDLVFVAELETNKFNALEQVSKTVDMEAFYKFWAVEGLLGFWDGYSGNRNNYYVYHNTETDKFHFLPWGADCLFQKFSQLDRDPRLPVSVKTNGRVSHELYQHSSCREEYREMMLWLLEEHWDETDLLSEVDRLEKMIRPHLSDSQKYTMNTAPVREFIRNRRRDIMAEIADEMPIWTRAPSPPPVIEGGQREEDNNNLNADNIWNVARQGKTKDIQRHLDAGVDVNARSPGGDTPLFPAALAGQVEAIKALIAAGADVRIVNRGRDSPLHGAAFLGRIDAVKLLVENEADLNARNSRGETPLDSASHDFGDIVEFIEFVIDSQRLDMTIKDVKEGRQKVVAYLKENGGKYGRDISAGTR